MSTYHMPGDTCGRSRGAGINIVYILLALRELRLQQRERCRANICIFFSLVPEKQESISIHRCGNRGPEK